MVHNGLQNTISIYLRRFAFFDTHRRYRLIQINAKIWLDADPANDERDSLYEDLAWRDCATVANPHQIAMKSSLFINTTWTNRPD